MSRKTITVEDFTGLFAFAEKEFGVDWNWANELFFNTILNYKELTQICIDDLRDQIDDGSEVSSKDWMESFELNNSNIDQLMENCNHLRENEIRACVIAGKYLISEGLTSIYINSK
jgi:hypothetical protein